MTYRIIGFEREEKQVVVKTIDGTESIEMRLVHKTDIIERNGKKIKRHLIPIYEPYKILREKE